MVVQDWIGGLEDRAEQFELGDGRLKRGEHEVADAQKAQACDCCWGIVGAEDEEEDLDDVMVALEVAQRGVSSQDIKNDIGELFLPALELFL